jgi:alkylation response protein AidB-like acyl-CoA dehydrogenase
LQEICLINEEISYACTGFSTTLFVNELALAPVHMYGSEYLKEKYFTRSASEPIVGAYSVTEPGTGSDVASVRTNAKQDSDGNWILNGQKMWISNGGVANWYVLCSRFVDVYNPN